MNDLQKILFKAIVKELESYESSTHNITGSQYDYYYWILKKKGINNTNAEKIVNKLCELVDLLEKETKNKNS